MPPICERWLVPGISTVWPSRRSQDNYVVQWGESDAKKPMGEAKAALPPEFTRPAAGLNFTVLPDPDTYARPNRFGEWLSGGPRVREGLRPGWCIAMAWSAPVATTT